MIELIVNPVAGNGHSKKIGEKAHQYLDSQNIEHIVSYTEYQGHATQIAKKAVSLNRETVLSVGGDGTSFEVAAGLIHSNVGLGIIPAGTGNDLIKSLGTPSDPMEALKFILKSNPEKMDVGLANKKVFLNVCGTGFDVLVLDYAEKAKRILKGVLPYLYGVICAILHHKPNKLHITLDNDQVIDGEYLLCSVANGKWIGGGIPISPQSNIDDGLFDVVLVNNIPRRRIPKYLPGLMKGKILDFDITEHYRSKHVKIEADNDFRFQADGEIFTIDSVQFNCLKHALYIYR